MATGTRQDDSSVDTTLSKEDAPNDPTAVSDQHNRRHLRYLPILNSVVAAAGVVAVAWGVLVANETLDSIDKSVDVASAALEAQLEQLKLAGEQSAAARDALWLDQRPWLAFHNYETVPPEIELGEDPIFRFHIVNTGKTPAFNVRLRRSRVNLHPNTYVFKEPATWIDAPFASTRSIYTDFRELTSVFPDSTTYYDIRIDVRTFVPSHYDFYRQKGFYFAVAVRLEYCDANRSLHWTQLGVAKIHSETELTVQHNKASLHPGEPDHPHCQEALPAADA